MKFQLILLLCLAGKICAQNLVPNSSFEIYEKCPTNFTVKYRKVLVPGWYIPSLGTPDFFNMCTNEQVGVPKNFMGFCLPKDGRGYAGIVLLLEPPKGTLENKPVNYREYLQTKLIKALEKDKWYEISFYFFVATYSTFAVNRLGVNLSNKKAQNKLTSGILELKPQLSLDSTKILKDPDTWFYFHGKYKAHGGEKYLTLGNFYDDKNTRFEICDLSDVSIVKKNLILSEQIAYYYIDSVSVKIMD